MKIAIVAEAVETHSGSRTEIELAKQFVKLGHRVLFYAHYDLSTKEASSELESAGVKVILVKSPKIKIVGKFFGGFSLAKKLKSDWADIISAHTTLPFLIGTKLSGIKVVSTYYGTQLDVWLDKIFPRKPNPLDKIINNFLNLIIKTIAFLQLSIADKIITQTKYCAAELKRLYGKTAPVVFWGDAPPHLLKIQNPTKKSSKVNLLSVSRIIPYKGFHILIDMVKELNSQFDNLLLTIIGSHPNTKYLAYLRKIKPKNVEIIIDAPDTLLSKKYQECDIYLTCDKFLFFGLPILEVASFAKPTVTLNYAAVNEVVINGKTGIVALTQKEFKDALIKLIEYPEIRGRLGKNAQRFASEHSWQKCAQDYLKLLTKWVNK